MKMYKYQKEHGEDMTYESEVEHKFDDRGQHDLTKQIDMLKARVADLESIEEVHTESLIKNCVKKYGSGKKRLVRWMLLNRE